MENEIMILLSVAGLLLLVGLGLLRMRALNRRTAEWQKRKKEREAERRRKEDEVMRQVAGIKNRDDLGNANAAVNHDPARAAKTVQKIMKD